MNYRLTVRYSDTGVITEQYFPDADTPDMIIYYLDNALENGAELEYQLQQRTLVGIETLDTNNTDWVNSAEWHE